MSKFLKSNCAVYWDQSDYLPLDAILDYWCEGDSSCRKAKKLAVISACERGIVEYIRDDGKTFDDSLLWLHAEGILLIKRTSFINWASKFEDSDPLANDKLTSKSKSNYLRTINALAAALIGERSNAPYKDAEVIVRAVKAANSKQELPHKLPIKAKSLASYLKEADQLSGESLPKKKKSRPVFD